MKHGFVVSLGLAIAISLSVVYGKPALETRATMMTEPTDEHLLSSQPQETCCPIVELRQYTLHPGKRDVLIELFDREFVESQEAVGMKVIGQFRDLDNPNRFVWLRGFRDMSSRARALEDFYGGPVWKANSKAANATMIDSENVLLLHPARPSSEFSFKHDRPAAGAKENPGKLLVATIYYFDKPVTSDFVGFFERRIKPTLEDSGVSILAYFVTESSANTFPKLPVREGENVFVWLSAFRDQAAYEDYEAARSLSERWAKEVSPELTRRLKRKPEVLKLSPTERSQLRG
jgi:quinol monooxygenase YgiN